MEYFFRDVVDVSNLMLSEKLYVNVICCNMKQCKVKVKENDDNSIYFS